MATITQYDVLPLLQEVIDEVTDTNKFKVDDHIDQLEFCAYWGDLFSFVLLALLSFFLPLVPCERVWKRKGEKVWWWILICANWIWNFSRFFLEGFVQAGVPRGFMEISLVYSSLWAYALGLGWGLDLQEYRRSKYVVRKIAKIQTVRVDIDDEEKDTKKKKEEAATNKKKLGCRYWFSRMFLLCCNLKDPITDDPNVELPGTRKNQWEIVVRKGCARSLMPFFRRKLVTEYKNPNLAQPDESGSKSVKTWMFNGSSVWFPRRYSGCYADRTRHYWRGIETRVEKHYESGDIEDQRNENTVWKVYLVEEEMHEPKLSSFMRVERLWEADRENPQVKLFKALYETVYLSCRDHADHRYLNLKGTDGGMWPNEDHWSPNKKPEHLAKQGGCTEKSKLGGIARRIAGDAVKYVFSHDPNEACRTKEHVKELNSIVDAIANDIVTEKLEAVLWPMINNESTLVDECGGRECFDEGKLDEEQAVLPHPRRGKRARHVKRTENVHPHLT